MKQETMTRNIRFELRLTKNELSELAQKARKAGLTKADFVRKAINNKEVKEAPHADVPMLIREMRRVGYNIDQILKRINSGNIIDLPQFRKDMEDLRNVTRMVVEEHYK